MEMYLEQEKSMELYLTMLSNAGMSTTSHLHVHRPDANDILVFIGTATRLNTKGVREGLLTKRRQLCYNVVHALQPCRLLHA